MSVYLDRISRAEVDDPVTFARYAHQTIGTKAPCIKEMARLRKCTAEFFEAYPHGSWQVLCTTVEWCRAKRRRLAMPWHVIDQVPWAYKDGLLPELDPHNHRAVDRRVEHAISVLMTTETDPWWTRAFRGATTLDTQRTLLKMWKEDHVSVL